MIHMEHEPYDPLGKGVVSLVCKGATGSITVLIS